MPAFNDLSQVPDKTRQPPEYAWWEFDIDDVTSGKGDLMMSITEATDPNLSRFLLKNSGKLIIYHGWADSAANPEPTLDYYKGRRGDHLQRRHRCGETEGAAFHGTRDGTLSQWSRTEFLGQAGAPLVEWVENGKAPDFIVATHSTDGVVDNERPICAYPKKAVYTGPAGGENDPANWVASSFTCQ